MKGTVKKYRCVRNSVTTSSLPHILHPHYILVSWLCQSHHLQHIQGSFGCDRMEGWTLTMGEDVRERLKRCFHIWKYRLNSQNKNVVTLKHKSCDMLRQFCFVISCVLDTKIHYWCKNSKAAKEKIYIYNSQGLISNNIYVWTCCE